MSINRFGVPVGDLVRRFLSGWIYELQALVPDQIRRALREYARWLCIAIRETGYELQAERRLSAPQTSRTVTRLADSHCDQLRRKEYRLAEVISVVSAPTQTWHQDATL